MIYYFACSYFSILFDRFYISELQMVLSVACKMLLELIISAVLTLLRGSNSCAMGVVSLCLMVAGGPSRHTTSLQCLYDVYTTSPTLYRRFIDVETTSCVYWGCLIVISLTAISNITGYQFWVVHFVTITM